MKRVKGITLIELIVASALMGLLFFSGLQMLSVIFTVHSTLQKPSSSGSWEQIRLETYLRNKLRTASQLEILDSGRILHFDNAKLKFQRNRACGRWTLLHQEGDLKPQEIFHWSGSDHQKFAFAWSKTESSQLLNIFMGQTEPSFSIWLRNQKS